MRFHSGTRRCSGFTLVELLVAMAITTLIVTVLVSITAIAMDTWNRSRAELRASRQAKAMVEVMAKDFESMVGRRGNKFEWMVAKIPSSLPGSGSLRSANAAEMVLFTASPDRYNGKIGTNDDKGGDVSCAGYLLEYKDPIQGNASDFSTFVLNRYLVNPDIAFTNLLGKDDLMGAFSSYRNELQKPENFICENVYQFTVTFHVEVTVTTGTAPNQRTEIYTVPVTVGPGEVSDFRFKGTGIEFTGTPNKRPAGVTVDHVKAGRLKGVEVALTVLSDSAVAQVRRGAFDRNKAAAFITKNSYNYSKFIPLPGL